MATPIIPDTKDWTWVLERPCTDCGFDPASVGRDDLGPAIRDSAAGWPARLDDADAAQRPRPDVWSPTEYACHVRDVHVLFAERLGQMLAEDGARFANWDQDATAVEQRYDLQDPAEVGAALVEAAEVVAAVYESVPDDAWGRRGVRSNGDVFTVETFGRYHLHDVVHHWWDVRPT
ncbi:MAG TPA: DinB family protein [Nocardioides sp.]|nr:DinB family protein [Nocardioides sp.]